MAHKPASHHIAQENAQVSDTELAADVAQEQGTEQTGSKAKRDVGPKQVYIHIASGVPKDAILSVHTNTRTLVDSMEQSPGSSYVKHTLPQGEPRGPKRK